MRVTPCLKRKLLVSVLLALIFAGGFLLWLLWQQGDADGTHATLEPSIRSSLDSPSATPEPTAGNKPLDITKPQTAASTELAKKPNSEISEAEAETYRSRYGRAQGLGWTPFARDSEVGETRLYRSVVPNKYPLTLVKRARDPNRPNAPVVTRAMVADHVLVAVNDQVDKTRIKAIAAKYGCEIRSKLYAPNLYLVSFEEPGLERLEKAMADFNAEVADIAYAEPDYVVHAMRNPNDPSFNLQWDKVKIQAPQAWDKTTGGDDVIIGIIDSGVQYSHVDLAANAWINPGEIAGNNLDDDGNGLTDDIYGWDFANNDNNPLDDDSHGTHCAGIAAARGNNGIGVAGVSWGARIMSLKFLTASGSGSTSDAVNCIYYAAQMRQAGEPVKLTSNSWGGGGSSTALSNAITFHQNQDMLFVAAAGNGGADRVGDNMDVVPDYPGAYSQASIINVANTTPTDGRNSSSNYGATRVDLGAPGTSIESTIPNNRYTDYSGTSMACPNVAGACALLWSYAPDSTYAEIKDLIMNGVDPVSSMSGTTVSGGRLNVFKSLNLLGLQVVESTPARDSVVTSPPTVFEVVFGDAANGSTISAGDFTVNGVPATSHSVLSATQVRFTFTSSPVTSEGLQTMAMPQDSVTRQSDGDGLNAWSATFRYDAQPLQVAAMVPADTTVASLPLSTIDLVWNENIDATSVQAGDLILSQGTSTSSSLPAANRSRFSLSGVVDEGVLNVEVREGSVSDTFGNGCDPYTGSIELDWDILPTAGFVSRPRAGSLVHTRLTTARHHNGDTDTIQVALRAGQTYMAYVKAGPGYSPSLFLRDGNVTVGSGNPLQIYNVPADGTYSLVISGSGVGNYEVLEAINAGIASATTSVQPIPSTLMLNAPLGQGPVPRHAVVGDLSLTGSHRFPFTAPGGITLAAHEPSQTLTLQLLQNGSLIDSRSGNENIIQVHASGSYEIVVSGSGEYTLHTTEGFHTDETFNESLALGQPMTRPAVLGGFSPLPPVLTSETEPNDDGTVGGSTADFPFANDARTAFVGSSSPYTATITGEISSGNDGDWDFYRFYAAPGDSLFVEQLGSQSGNGTLIDPWFRLYDRNGTMIANNDDIQAGIQRESRLTYASFAYSGEYYMCAGSWGPEVGTYRLIARLTTTSLQTPVRRDVFRVDLDACEILDADIVFPDRCPKANSLQANLSLLDASGTARSLPYTAAAAETVYLDLTPSAGSSGSYVLSRAITGGCFPLVVRSEHGLPNPGVGTNLLASGQVALSVNSPVELSGMQYVCVGWTGTGDVPASGSGTTVSITLDEPSSITWLWETNVYITVGASTGGSASPASDWHAIGSSVTLSATPDATYRFDQWSDGASDQVRTITASAPATYTAAFTKLEHPLTIVSAQGSPTPPVGTQQLIDQTMVNASVASPVLGGAGSFQYVCLGWTGTGSAPASGTAASVPAFPIEEATTIEWLWQTNVWFEPSASAGGSVNLTPTWLPLGSGVTLEATPNQHYVFAGWTGDLSGTSASGTSLQVLADQARQITATFTRDTYLLTVDSPHGTPAPTTGTLPSESSINASITPESLITNGTRLSVSGWTGTGAAPASGTGASIPAFSLTEPSSIAWNWTTNYYLDVSADAGGWVDQTSAWFDVGELVTLTANASNHWAFAGWQGSQTGASPALSFGMMQPNTVTATFSRVTYDLEIVSAHGSTTPSVGTHPVLSESTLSVSASPATITSGGTRLDVAGWTSSGAVTDGNGASTPVFSMTEPTRIEWLWNTNHLVTVDTSGSGSVDLSTDWHPAGSSLTITATPGPNQVFAGWNGSPSTPNDNPLTVAVDNELNLTAVFAAASRTLAVSSPFGMSSPPVGTHTYAAGSSVTVTQNQTTDTQGATRYLVTGWTGTGDVAPGNGAQATFSILQDSTLTWVWRTEHRLDLDAGPGGTVDPVGSRWFAEGDSVTLTASPDAFQAFAGWSDGNTDNPRTVIMTGPVELTANFATNPYDLTITSPHGPTTPPVGTQTLAGGTSVTGVSAPNMIERRGTQFINAGWIATGSAPSSGTGGNVPDFTLAADTEIIWQWTTNVWIAPSATSGGSVDEAPAWYALGSSGTILATPDPHFEFVGWIGDTTGATLQRNVISFTADQPRNLTASFRRENYTLEVVSNHGSTSPSIGTHVYPSETVVSVSVEEPVVTAGGTRHEVTGWTNGQDTFVGSATGDLTLEAPTVITFLWSTSYFLTVESSAGGTVSGPSGWLPADAQVTLSATPSAHHSFAGWSDGEMSNPRTITMNGPVSVTPVFTRDTYNLTVQSPYGTATPAVGIHSYPAEDLVSASISPAVLAVDGSTRVIAAGWTGSGSFSVGGDGTQAGPFPILEASSVQWRWDTEHFLTLAVSGNGSLNMNSAWWPERSVVSLLATPSLNHRFVEWSDGETANPRSITIDDGRSLTAVFETIRVPVTVYSPHGTSNPDGAFEVDQASSLTVEMSPTRIETNGVQWILDGWEGTGDIVGGSGKSAGPFTILIPSSLHWKWTTNYFVQVGAAGTGSVNQTSGWFPAGTVLTFEATPSAGQLFAGWNGDIDTAAGSPTTLVVDGPKQVEAVFGTQFVEFFVESERGTSIPAIGSNLFPQGSTITPSINAPVLVDGNTRFTAIGWTGTGDIVAGSGSSAGPFTLTQDSSLTWLWSTSYFGTVTSGPGGSATPSSAWHTHGASVQLKATPDPFYSFGSWSGSLNANAPTLNLVVTEPFDVLASFVRDEYTVEVRSAHGSPVPPRGLNALPAGTEIRPSNAQLITDGGTQWVNQTGTIPPFILTENTEINWLWTTNYWIETASDTGGSITPLPSAEWHPYGGELVLQATPKPHYRHTGWRGDTDGTVESEASIRIPVDRPRRVTATFEREAYTLNVTSPHGTVSGGGSYPALTEVEASVSPQSITNGTTRFQLLGWEGAGAAPASGRGEPVGFTLSESSEVRFVWESNMWLEVSAQPGGTVDRASAWFDAGALVEITATPARFQRFSGWLGDVPTGSSNPLLLTMDQARSVIAVFEPVPVSLTISSPYPVTTKPSLGTHVYDAGATVDVELLDDIVNEPSGTTRHLARGFVGTGDFSDEDAGDPAATQLTQDSTVSFAWSTEHYLTTASQVGGIVNLQSGWHERGAELSLIASPEAGYRFRGWLGDVSENEASTNPLPVSMDAPRSLTASFEPDLVTITGGGQVWSVVRGSVVAFTNDTPSSVQNGVRRTLEGYTGTGEIDAGDGAVIGPFIATSDSTFDWVYATDYRLELLVSGNGSISPSSRWVPAGDLIDLIATPADHAVFQQWVGDVAAIADVTANRISVRMTQARSLTALFATASYDVVADDGSSRTHPAGTELAYTTPTFEVVGANLRDVVTGYEGTGSIGSGLGSMIPAFELWSDSSYRWLRVREINLQLVENIMGPEGWIGIEELVSLTPIPPVGTQFEAWSNGETTVPLVIAASEASELWAVFSDKPTPPPPPPEMVTLTVRSEYGAPSPSGSVDVERGSTIMPTLPETTVLDANDTRTRHVSQGADQSLPLTLTEDTVLTWLWETEQYATLASEGNGDLDQASGWRVSGDTLEITPAPAADHEFSHWTGDTNDLEQTKSGTWSLTITEPIRLTAHFKVVLSERGVPKPWFTEEELPFDDRFDGDGDGADAFEEWFAGTDPSDRGDFLHLRLDGPDKIVWPSVEGRMYSLWVADQAEGPYELLRNNLGATPPLNTLPAMESVDPTKFYRLVCEERP